ncbi:MAG TPA: lipid-A-disaccharide synthase [Micropepsaceae bacterium]|nr:lipid-A-disaccharide synthase [Micropepsaceae bacterium]
MNETASSAQPLTIMLIAGEPSGDRLGAQLMAGLKRLAPGRVRVTGVGGAAMTAEGLRSLFPLDATSVMGLREVVPRIPEILRRVRIAKDFALRTRPDLVVFIDSPDFTHRIARALKRADPKIKTANYAPPQVWASRSYRARLMARYMDAVMTLFPFEAKFFASHGIRAYTVGFPVIERAEHVKGGESFRARRGIAPDDPFLVVLPGSRANEIRFILPTFKEAVRILSTRMPRLKCVLPTVSQVVHLVKAAVTDWPTPLAIIEDEQEKFAAFDAADAALAASGTVTMELAIAGTPMVVGYRTGWLSYSLGIHLMRVPYMVLVNLILGREAVPEFLQAKCTPAALVNALVPLLTKGEARERQIRDLQEAVGTMQGGGDTPSIRAARAVLELAETTAPAT